MQVWEGVEKSIIDIPTSELVTSSGDLSIDPDLLKYIDIAKRGPKVVVRAKGYIGQFRLNSEHLLVIKSVLSNDLVARMLSLAVSGKYDALRDVHSTSGASAGFDITIHIILQFMHALKVRRNYGMWKRYQRNLDEGTSFRGRMLFSPTIKRKWAASKSYETVSETFSLSANIAENRIVKYAILQAMSVLRGRRIDGPEIVALRGFLMEFAAVPVPREPEVRVLAERLAVGKVGLPYGRSYYQELLVLAAWIIRARKYLPYYETGSLNGNIPVFAFDMADFFEQYVRKFLKQEFSATSFLIQDGNQPEVTRQLFVNNSKHVVKPDLVVSNSKRAVAVGDVKYKPRVSEGDRYQVLTHAKAFGVHLAFVVRPDASLPTSVRFRGTVGNESPIRYVELVLFIGSDDHAAEERKLADLVEREIQ